MSTTQPEGYLAMPAAGTGGAVLILHAWWGLNGTIRGFCDRLAEAGFVAFAADLYQGKVTDQISEAETLVGAMESRIDETRREVSEAVAFLKAQAGVDSIAVVGFSMGAFYALDLSAREPDSVGSVVLFYGAGPADFNLSRATYLGHFAANDPYEPAENVEWLKDELEKAGRTATFHVYEETGHWFFEPDRADAYNPTAAALAWERTLAFLGGT